MRSLTDSSAGLPDGSPFFRSSPSPLHRSVLHPSPSDVCPQLSRSLFAQNPFFSVRESSLMLSDRARDAVDMAIRGSWAETTLSRYMGAIKQFIRFCDAERVPEHFRFPADEFVLCAFAASSFGRHTGATPRARLSALKAWHLAHNVEWKGSTRLRYVLNGVTKAAPSASKRAPRPPITATMLSQLVDSLDLTFPLDAAVAACAATAFWGQCRLGELLPPSTTLPPPSPLPVRSDFKRSVKNPQSCLLHLPATKTHRLGQDVVLVDQCRPINPISLLKNHIRVSDVPSNSHIFSYSSPHGPVLLSKPVFIQRCNAVWSTLGYPRATGHCFRIGGTTELLISGTPADVVKATGRWSSDSFLRYWRSLDLIAPQYIRNIHRSQHRYKHPLFDRRVRG
jgi:hypothetical protein